MMPRSDKNEAGKDNGTPVLINQNVAYASLSDDEAAVLNVESREFFTLNATGKTIMQALEDGSDLADIVSRVASNFEVSEESCRGDVVAFLKSLEQAGIVEFV